MPAFSPASSEADRQQLYTTQTQLRIEGRLTFDRLSEVRSPPPLLSLALGLPPRALLASACLPSQGRTVTAAAEADPALFFLLARSSALPPWPCFSPSPPPAHSLDLPSPRLASPDPIRPHLAPTEPGPHLPRPSLAYPPLCSSTRRPQEIPGTRSPGQTGAPLPLPLAPGLLRAGKP